MVGRAMQDQVEPSAERGPTTSKPKPTASRIGIMVIIVGPFLLTAIFTFSFVLNSSRPKPIVYQGESLEAWFFGSGRDFLTERTRSAAQAAIDGLGTNAFPFLLTILKGNGGSGVIYFKLYRALPAQVQARLPYPILGDDLKAIALDHIRRMHRLPTGQVQTLADCVPGLPIPG